MSGIGEKKDNWLEIIGTFSRVTEAMAQSRSDKTIAKQDKTYDNVKTSNQARNGFQS